MFVCFLGLGTDDEAFLQVPFVQTHIFGTAGFMTDNVLQNLARK